MRRATFGEQVFTESLVQRLPGAGLLEALTAPHGVERYLQALAPRYAPVEPRAEVLAVRHATVSSTTLLLAPNAHWRGFRAGQFVTLTVEIDGVRRSRCYSPASSEHARDGLFELTVRAHEHGLVSRHLQRRAQPGIALALAQASGDFTLPSPRPQRLLLISGGSGITPVISMLRTLCDEDHEQPVTFLHYTRTRGEHPYLGELEQIARRHRNVRVENVFTRTRGGGSRARLTHEQLRALDPRYREAEIYACGPPPLLEAARALPDGARVHTESFRPPVSCAGAGEAATVRFRASGLELSGDGITLLEQAERAGLRPAYGCRMGICHTCTTRKLAGRVRNVHDGALSSDEPQDIQLCVSVPAGEVELDL